MRDEVRGWGRRDVPIVWGVGTGACVWKSPRRMRSVSGYLFRFVRVVVVKCDLSDVGLVCCTS